MQPSLPELQGYPNALKILTGPSTKEEETLDTPKVISAERAQITHPIWKKAEMEVKEEVAITLQSKQHTDIYGTEQEEKEVANTFQGIITDI